MGYPKTLYVQHVTAEFFGRAWEDRPAGYSVRYDLHDDEAQAKIARLQAAEKLAEAATQISDSHEFCSYATRKVSTAAIDALDSALTAYREAIK